MQFGRVIPILRMFDEAKAREYYVDFLGFTIDFEHRFEPGAPLYMQVSRGGAALHLSEHHGDASPGASVRVHVDALDALHAELIGKGYKYNRPGIEAMPWGLREMKCNDPFFNRIIFVEAKD
jgi:uncharacterized glyoxalase superfamily protein PhnB